MFPRAVTAHKFQNDIFHADVLPARTTQGGGAAEEASAVQLFEQAAWAPATPAALRAALRFVSTGSIGRAKCQGSADADASASGSHGHVAMKARCAFLRALCARLAAQSGGGAMAYVDIPATWSLSPAKHVHALATASMTVAMGFEAAVPWPMPLPRAYTLCQWVQLVPKGGGGGGREVVLLRFGAPSRGGCVEITLSPLKGGGKGGGQGGGSGAGGEGGGGSGAGGEGGGGEAYRLCLRYFAASDAGAGKN